MEGARAAHRSVGMTDSRDVVVASVVDHCHAALTVLLSRWLIQQGLPDSTIKLDLGELAKRVDEAMGSASRVTQVLARLHSLRKPNERDAKSLRAPVDGDADLTIQAMALTLRDFGWAID